MEEIKFKHPEIKENEVLMINLSKKEFETWSKSKPSFVQSWRLGKVAYVTNGESIVSDLYPCFAILTTK